VATVIFAVLRKDATWPPANRRMRMEKPVKLLEYVWPTMLSVFVVISSVTESMFAINILNENVSPDQVTLKGEVHAGCDAVVTPLTPPSNTRRPKNIMP